MNSFSIAGLKHSDPVAVVRAPGAGGPGLRAMLRGLAEESINLPLAVWQRQPRSGPGLCFCVEEARAPRVLALARQEAQAHGLPSPSLAPPAVIVTLYPLGRSLRLPALVLAALARAGLRPLALGTSLSAVAALVAQEDLDPALAAMQAEFELPAGISPPRAGVRVVQTRPGEAASLPEETVAIYAEQPIRCYGLEAKEGQVLCQAEPPAEALAATAGELAALEPPPGLGFLAGSWGKAAGRLSICLPADQAGRLARALAQAGAGGPSLQEAALIHLLGPHFGDRYGIAVEALAGLAQAGVEPLVMSGVLHSLFVAVEPPAAPAAIQGLATRFQAP